MPTISPKQVAAFRAVMLTGRVTGAASMLHLTQPAVSRLIKEFELTLGLKLFERAGTGIAPTREAHSIFAEVERLFTGLDRIMELAIELREEPAQSIRIAAFPALANGFIPRFLMQYLKRTPECCPSIFSLHSSDVIDNVAEGKSDVGLSGTTPEHPLISVVAMESLNFVVALPAGHRLARKPFLEPTDFENEPFISTSQTVMNLRLGAMFGAHNVNPNIVARVNQSSVGCAMVAAGLGVSIVDPFSAMDARPSGIEIRPIRPAIPFEFAYVLPAKRPPSSVTTQIIRSLQGEFAKLRAAQPA